MNDNRARKQVCWLRTCWWVYSCQMWILCGWSSLVCSRTTGSHQWIGLLSRYPTESHRLTTLETEAQKSKPYWNQKCWVGKKFSSWMQTFFWNHYLMLKYKYIVMLFSCESRHSFEIIIWCSNTSTLYWFFFKNPTTHVYKPFYPRSPPGCRGRSWQVSLLCGPSFCEARWSHLSGRLGSVEGKVHKVKKTL